MGNRVVVWWEDMDLPFSQGLMNKYNELNSQEHWYGVLEEAQEDMCGILRLMCGRRMG
jgi:hypothetical protein